MKRILIPIFQLAWTTLLAGILFAYAMFEGGFASWFLFDSYLPIYIYQICLRFYPLQSWNVQRTLSTRKLRAGDPLCVTISIKRKFRFPLYFCIIEEIIPDSLNKLDIRKRKYEFMDAPQKLSAHRKMKKLIFPRFKSHMNVSYELVQIPRGKHIFRTVRIRTGDIFGFVKKQYQFDIKDEWVVYPYQPAVNINESVSATRQGAFSSSVMPLQSGNVVSGIREYVPGDRFSWIDWKQTAKKNDVMTKEFEKDNSADVLILLDACKDGEQNWIQFDALMELAATFINVFEKRSSQTTMVCVGKTTDYFPVTKSKMQSDRIYQYLATAEPQLASFSFALLQELPRLPTGVVTYVLTSYLNEKLFDVLKKLSMHHHMVHVIWIHSGENRSDLQQRLIRKMIKQGMAVSTVTKRQLTAKVIEVKAF